MSKCVPEFEKLLPKRNRIIHGAFWDSGSKLFIQTHWKATGSKRAKFEAYENPIKPEFLDATISLADNILVLVNKTEKNGREKNPVTGPAGHEKRDRSPAPRARRRRCAVSGLKRHSPTKPGYFGGETRETPGATCPDIAATPLEPRRLSNSPA